MQQMFSFSQPGAPKEMQAAQEEMNAAIVDLTKKYSLANGIFSVLLLALAASLVWGGIKTLQMADSGRRLLMVAMMLGVPLEIARAIPMAAMQLEMSPIMQQHMGRVMESARPPGKKLSEADEATMNAMGSAMGIVMWVAVGFMLCWVLAKVLFFALSARHLGKPAVRETFLKASAPQTSQAALPSGGPAA
jgi:hypothetical protein